MTAAQGQRGAPVWSNWAGNQRAQPRLIARPGSVEQVQEAVRTAAGRHEKVRPVGAGHSFAPLCVTDGVLLDLADLTGVVDLDEPAGTVTVYAGTRISALGTALAEHGLALANQGDIDTQAIAGAVSTGTHGTGASFGSFSDELRSIDLVSADGEMHRFDEDGGPEFRAAALSLGVLGVATRMTLRVVPAYKLRTATRALGWEQLNLGWDDVQAQSRNAEFFWLPAHDVAVTKTFTATDEPVATLQPGPLAPPGTVARYLTPDRVDWSHRAFPSIRSVPFVEMEYTVPLPAGMATMTALRHLMRTRHPAVTWAVEYRTQKGDDRLLSSTQNEPAVTISVHDAPDRVDPSFLRDAEALFRSYGGRPHWGKLHTLQAEDARRLYPQLPAFDRLRRRLDPNGAFLNAHLYALLTSPAGAAEPPRHPGRPSTATRERAT